MTQLRIDSLDELENKASNIKAVDPSDQYLESGNAILSNLRRPRSTFGFRKYVALYPIAACVLAIVGFTFVLTDRSVSNDVVFDEELHNSFANGQLLDPGVTTPISQEEIFAATVSNREEMQVMPLETLFAKYCQECHTREFFERFRPESFEGTREELDALTIQAMRKLFVPVES